MTERERLIELIRFGYGKGRANENVKQVEETIADYLLANGVIVPPCKVGDVVYVITDCTGDMRRTVTGFTQNSILSYAMTLPMNKIGKTVFLTREEAEKALAERNELNK